MLGFMSTSLSQSIARTLDWAQIDQYPIKITWDKLPRKDEPRAPLLPWVFGYAPNYFKSRLHWWDNPHQSSSKPVWWDKPDKLVSGPMLPMTYDLTVYSSGFMRSAFQEIFSATRSLL